MFFRTIHIALLLLLCASCAAAEPVRYGYIVNKEYPHSTDSYTQGLQIVDGVMYESTGLNGASRLMRVDMKSGGKEVLARLPERDFGEGITILGDTIYMLTWRSKVCYLFDRTSGKKIDQREYPTEGWGLTTDGERLYMSDGSNRITIRERGSFREISFHPIYLFGRALPYLNELEWIEGRIWANVYTTDMIVIINPTTWQVEGVVDLTGLLPQKERTAQTDVLNGIAYDEATKKIYVTGKNWSKLYEIEIIEI